MALDTTLSGWLDELKFSKAYVKEFLTSINEDKKNFVGLGYRDGYGRKQPENHALEWFSIMRPQLLMGNPRVRFVAPNQGETEVRARALTYCVNAWTQQTRMRDLNEQLLMDWGFKWAVCMVTSEPRVGFTSNENPPYLPAAYRIPFDRFLFDGAAMNPAGWRWVGHMNIAMKDELLEKAKDEKSGWDAEAIELLQKTNVKIFRDNRAYVPDRDEICYWELWAPGIELEESPGADKGYFGTVFTVGDNQAENAGWIRKPRPYFGPPQGPYVFGGDLIVPDFPLPLSPISSCMHQAEHLNRIARSEVRGVEAYKKLVLVPDAADSLKEQVRDGEDLHVFTYSGDPSKVIQLELGGVTQQHFAAKESARATLDRVSGITDLMRGEVNPRNKATADALASQASTSKSGFNRMKFADLVGQILLRVAYFFDRDEEVEIELGPQAAGQFVDMKGKPTTLVKGGLAKGQKPEEFFNMNLQLDIGSMERDLQSDNMMRMQIMDQKLQLAPALMQASLYMDVQAYLDLEAELTGVVELKKLFDVQKMQSIAMMMLQQQGQPQQPQPQQSPQPEYKPIQPMNRPDSLPQRMAASATSGPSASKGASQQLAAKPKAVGSVK
jgi:hypothetical protein